MGMMALEHAHCWGPLGPNGTPRNLSGSIRVRRGGGRGAPTP